MFPSRSLAIRTLARAIVVIALAAGCAQPAEQPTSQPSAQPDSASVAQSPEKGASTSAAASPAVGAAGQGAAVQRCHTAQLTARLGARATASPGQTSGQTAIPLVYTNTGKTSCLLRGVPGLDLHGPADPNGPVYQLPRQDRGGAGVTLTPGASASARVVVLTYENGSVGSAGSTRWTPTQLVTIPPGETTPLTVAWPAGVTVLRQDEATHPGSWVESFTAG